MSNKLKVSCNNPTQAHAELVGTVWPFIKANLMAGRRMVLTVEPEKRTYKQNSRYWSRGILSQIAEKVVVDGRRFSAEVWHEQFKRQFIGIEELPNGQIVGASSTELSIAEFSVFVDQVEAFAATELGVMFEEA